MEKVMSVEEKIRRAEEIYQRRKQVEMRPITKVTVNEKKDIKLLKKMIIQILVCVGIYLLIYTVQNNQYIFSQDFINKLNEILSYDTNFVELYEGIKNQILNLTNVKSENQENDANEQEQTDSRVQAENTEINVDMKGLSQMEIDIQNIKNTTTFVNPLEGTITSKYGQKDAERSTIPREHTGIDIAANLGTKIKSATDGEVVLTAEEDEGYGKYLKVQIGEVTIIYAHCNSLYVKQGDKVVQGQEIAEVGSTGNSTGPHLHFEVKISDRTIDPQMVL